jgi:phosphate starvation-inducible PhoH-like protein
MPKKNSNASRNSSKTAHTPQGKDFHIELLNTAQKMAWAAFQKHDVLFLLGPAGTGKSFLATAFAIKSLLAKECNKIVLTRPIVEAGESLGFLPGDFEEKVNPYMMPIYDCMEKLLGRDGPFKEKVLHSCEIAPLAFMRGRTFHDSVCILDEAQNASMTQLKLYLSRFDETSKLIITGDPNQSDLHGPVALSEVVRKLQDVPGIGIVEFKYNSIVRHPLISEILQKLGE